VHLNFGIQRSPAPASFIRIGKSFAPDIVPSSHGFNELADGYSPTEYATIKLHKRLGSGAVGVVYKGTLELKDAVDGETLSKPIVVKLAFSTWQKNRMRKEYAVYSHLATKEGIEGVVRVHGFFKDAENEYLALVLNDAGMSLREREFMRTNAPGSPLKTTAEERYALSPILSSLV
jgi:serine/threonine protein kinase